jgi:hypothetical protein
MKNDLERLKMQTDQLNAEKALELGAENDDKSNTLEDEQVKETKQGKIRNSIYFIISRGIKFGKDTDIASYMLN